MARVPGVGLLNRTSEELGGKARGSTPPRASNHKFQVAGFKSQVTAIEPETLNLKLETDVRAGDVTDSIEVLQTSCEGLNPSQSTKLRRSSFGSRALVL